MTAPALQPVGAATLALLGLISAATLPVRAQGADDIYAKAKTEGAFVLYVGGPTAPWEATARIFEQRYPGIKVAITGGFSNVLDKKIDQQIKDNKLEVDTAIFQTLQDLVRWKSEGQLLPYKPPGFEAIDQSFKDADGAFYGVMVNAMPYMFNSQHVAAADVPNAAPDFLKPQFKGRMVTPYPADDDATLWLFHKIVLKYGWDYMDKYIATGTWSSRKDVPPPKGFKPIFDYPVANDYRSFLVNEAQLVALRKRFEGYTGPVVNAGGVR